MDELKHVFKKGSIVHSVLSHSYIVFSVFFMVGVVLHLVYKTQLFVKPLPQNFSFLFIIAGSVLIYWAQKTSGRSKVKMLTENTPREFARGPYKYSRNPTHIGITVVLVGFALVINSFYLVLCAIFASLFTKFIFLKKEEDCLEKIYGQVYIDYKKKVRSFL